MLQSIRLQNFRSYKDYSFTLDEGVNVVIGKNGSGKTNLLEAVLVLCQGGSYRTSDANLVMFNKGWTRLDGAFEKHNRTVKIAVDSHKNTKKSFVVDDKNIQRLSQKNKIPTVLFEPNHLQLLIRGPEFRRAYLDNLLIVLSPGYSVVLNHYKRSLLQRNKLLKMNTSNSLEQLFIWDVRLSDLAGKIVAQRLKLLNNFNKDISKIYSNIANKKSDIFLGYVSKTNQENYSSDLLKQLKSSLDIDIMRGYTSRGPHRDDMQFIIDGDNAADTASRGETRTILLSLKIFELLAIEKVYDKKPILLLDDVFSELDTTRQHALVNYFENHQIIITTTDIKALIDGVRGKIFEL